MDVANLNISIKTSGVSGAKNDLNNLDNAAKRAKQSADQFRGTLLAVKTAVAALAGSAIFAKFTQTADAMDKMNASLKIVSGSLSEYLLRQKAVHQIARETHSDIETTADLYTKLAPALKDLGKSTDETNRIFLSLTKVLKQGGASAGESETAIKNFAQAINSGTVKLDKLNSIVETSPALLRYLAETLGINVGKLRELAAEGKLTAETFADAFDKMYDKVSEDVDKLPVTVGSAFTDLKTEISLLTDDFNKVSDATGGISGAIEYFANLIKKNRPDIVEFGRDAYRTFEFVGVSATEGLARLGKSFYGIYAALVSAVDLITNFIQNRLNSFYKAIEDGYNSFAEKLHLDRIEIKPSTIGTDFSKDVLEKMKSFDEVIQNAQKARENIVKELASNTTRQEYALREAKALTQLTTDIMRGKQDQKAVPIGQGNNKKGVAKAAKDTSEQEAKKAERERIRQINEELKLKDRMFDLQKRAADLSYSEVEKNQKLVTIEYERAQASYKALLDKKKISKQFYDEAMALEERLYQKQMFDASEWGRVMESGLSGIENAMSSFLDYSSDGFMKFGDLAKSVLSEIYKALVRELIISQMIAAIRRGIGLFGGVGGAANAGAGAGLAGAIPHAQGGVYASAGLHAYANSIVSKPTLFAFANGGIPNLGVMGEKNGGSPEAIMPLARTSSGDLGVKAQLANIKIEVINQTKEDAQVTNTQVRQDPEGYVVSLVMSGYAKNKNGIRDMLRK